MVLYGIAVKNLLSTFIFKSVGFRFGTTLEWVMMTEFSFLGSMSFKEVIFCSEMVKIPVMSFVLSDCVCDLRITKMLIEQDGSDWRQNLPEIPMVPLSAQQHRKDEPSAEVLQARAARAEQEKGELTPHQNTDTRQKAPFWTHLWVIVMYNSNSKA